MKYLFLVPLFCSCSLLPLTRPTYTYRYLCPDCTMKDTVIYSNVLYYPGDTVIVLPSKKMIIITDVALSERPKFFKPQNNDRTNQTTHRPEGKD